MNREHLLMAPIYRMALSAAEAKAAFCQPSSQHIVTPSDEQYVRPRKKSVSLQRLLRK